MKRYLLLFLALILVATALVACGGNTETSAESEESTTAETTAQIGMSDARRQEIEELVAENIKRAKEIGNSTIDKYGAGDSQYLPVVGYTLARYYNPSTKKTSETASVWHYTAYYAMLCRMVDISEAESADYAKFTELTDIVYNGFAWYSGTGDIITYRGTFERTFYGVNRAGFKGKANIKGDQMVYDDQMWIIRECVYRYQQTGEQKYLDEATRLAVGCIQGWDYTLDENGEEYGGIPWGPYYSNKHTCSNAPIIMPLVEIYEILKEKGDETTAQYYLDWAVKIYKYTRDNLRESNFLYGDSTGYQRIEKKDSNGKTYYVTVGRAGHDATHYSYNTGAMISGAVALYRVTGKSSYLTDAKQSASASFRNFCKSTNGVYWYPNTSETTWFNLVLLQGYLDLYAYDQTAATKYIETFQSSYDNAYENYVKDGLLPRDFVNGWDTTSKFDTNSNVMDHASSAQIYAMLAMWNQARLDADTALKAENGIVAE